MELRPHQDVIAAKSPRAARARAHLSRANSHQQNLRSELHKEAESAHSKESHRLARETRDLRDTLALLRESQDDTNQRKLKGSVSDSILDAKSRPPVIIRIPTRVVEAEYEPDLPRRLRPTIQDDLKKAIKKGAEARWERIQREKLGKLGLLAPPNAGDKFAEFARNALTPPPSRLRRASSPSQIGGSRSASSSPKTSPRRKRNSHAGGPPGTLPQLPARAGDAQSSPPRAKPSPPALTTNNWRRGSDFARLPDIAKKS